VNTDDEFDRIKVTKNKDNAHDLEFPSDVLVNAGGEQVRWSANRPRDSAGGVTEAPSMSWHRVRIGNVSTLSDRPDASTERWRRRAHTMAYVNLTYSRLPRPIRVAVSIGLMWAARRAGIHLPTWLGGF